MCSYGNVIINFLNIFFVKNNYFLHTIIKEYDINDINDTILSHSQLKYTLARTLNRRHTLDGLQQSIFSA